MVTNVTTNITTIHSGKDKTDSVEHPVAVLMICQTYTQIHEGKLVRQNFGVDVLVGNNKKTPKPPSFLIIRVFRNICRRIYLDSQALKLQRTRETGIGWAP